MKFNGTATRVLVNGELIPYETKTYFGIKDVKISSALNVSDSKEPEDYYKWVKLIGQSFLLSTEGEISIGEYEYILEDVALYISCEDVVLMDLIFKKS